MNRSQIYLNYTVVNKERSMKENKLAWKQIAEKYEL